MKPTGNKRRRAVTRGLWLTGLLALALLLTDGATHPDRSTRGVAKGYLSALLDNDKGRALGLIRLEPLCSGAGMEAEVDRHLALFASATVRNVNITVRDLTGSVAYNPGTEGAEIVFEYQPRDSLDWRVARIGVVTFDYPGRQFHFRAICWLWTGDT